MNAARLDHIVPLAMKFIRMGFSCFISSAAHLLPVGYLRRSSRHTAHSGLAPVVFTDARENNWFTVWELCYKG